MNRSEVGMGFDYGNKSLLNGDIFFKRKYRWMFNIKGVCGGSDSTSPLLPPGKSGRPSLSFKEMDAQHITETVYFPGKPEWKPISITLYDIKTRFNPVIQWIKKIYEVSEKEVSWKPSVESSSPQAFKRECSIDLYDGVGNIVEEWKLENVWPISIDFGDLDFNSSDILTIDLQLRYDRAYFIEHPCKKSEAKTKELTRDTKPYEI
jgi:hypothetical protein